MKKKKLLLQPFSLISILSVSTFPRRMKFLSRRGVRKKFGLVSVRANKKKHRRYLCVCMCVYVCACVDKTRPVRWRISFEKSGSLRANSVGNSNCMWIGQRFITKKWGETIQLCIFCSRHNVLNQHALTSDKIYGRNMIYVYVHAMHERQ